MPKAIQKYSKPILIIKDDDNSGPKIPLDCQNIFAIPVTLPVFCFPIMVKKFACIGTNENLANPINKEIIINIIAEAVKAKETVRIEYKNNIKTIVRINPNLFVIKPEIAEENKPARAIAEKIKPAITLSIPIDTKYL
jgi:hypothetical protein